MSTLAEAIFNVALAMREILDQVDGQKLSLKAAAGIGVGIVPLPATHFAIGAALPVGRESGRRGLDAGKASTS